MKQLSLLIISSEFPPGPGGIGQHTASLVKALPKERKVDIITNQDYSNEEEIRQFNKHFLGTQQNLILQINRRKFGAHFLRILQILMATRTKKPEAIIVSGRFPLWMGGLLKQFFPKVKIIGFVHGTEITSTKKWIKMLNTWALKKLDHIHPVSHFTASHLPDDLESEKIQIIPNGIDQDLLQKAIKSSNALPLNGNPSLLTVGKVSFRKGQHRVIKALPRILETYPNAHYHMVGLPAQQKEMESLAESLRVREAISFHGRLSRVDLYKAYAGADVFLMLSENQADGDVEGFGIAILEANAFGLPAIGAKGCGIEDAISPESGKLVNGDDVHAIEDALYSILNNKQDYKQAALSWAKQHTWPELIKKLIRWDDL